MAVILWDAFITDPFLGPMGKHVPIAELYAYSERRNRRAFETAALEGMRFVKVVDLDCDNKMMAFAKWQHPQSFTDEQRAAKKALSQGNPFGDYAPEGYNVKLSDDFFARIREKHSKWVDDDKDYVLSILAVSPQYQRKGLGSLLISEGLALVDRDGARTYIEASPNGLQLYQRHGWKLIDEIQMDMTRYGGNDVASEKLLIRAPHAS